jgi:hypothetical protein
MLQRLLILLLAGAAVFPAQAQIPPRGLTHLDTTTGFPFGGSFLWIRGNEIVDAVVSCSGGQCPPESPCPVTVFFGDAQATVHYAMSDLVAVTAPAHAEGVVDVTVRVNGKPDLTLAHAYTYSRDAVTRPEDYAMYLVPLVANRLPGAHGSLWVSEWSAFNASVERAVLAGVSVKLEPGETKMLQAPQPAAGRDGAFVYVPRLLANDLPMELRVRDVSRVAEGWGTELPLAGRRSYARVHQLLELPNHASYRLTLRVYGDSDVSQPVTVRVYPMDSDTPIETREFDLAGVSWEEAVAFPVAPAYLQVDPITDVVRASGHERLRIEVFTSAFGEPPSEPGIWTFVSITNNATQQVTAITPRQY